MHFWLGANCENFQEFYLLAFLFVPVQEARQTYGRWHSVGHRLTDAGLYMAQVTVSYLLMLIAMTYNIGLFMAVIFGLGFGYLLFLSGPDQGYKQQEDDSNSGKFFQ